MTRLTAPHRLQNFAVIIRAMGGNGAEDQRAALNELYRRGLWLGDDQASEAIARAGFRIVATITAAGPAWEVVNRDGGSLGVFDSDKAARGAALNLAGYERAAVPIEARETLPVIFRAEWNDSPKTGNIHVTAVFPTLPGTSDPHTATCYAHVGQHSACARSWYRATRPATEQEAAPLLAELRGIYERDDDPEAVRLVIAKRWTRDHDEARLSAYGKSRFRRPAL